MKILLVTPGFPVPETGAEQSDRANGMRQLVRLGHEVHVIAKMPEHADRSVAEAAAESIGVRLTLVPYRFSNRTIPFLQKVLNHLGKLQHPLYLDGAAYEYSEPWIREAFRNELESFRPDIAWFDYTYLWPLYAMARKQGVGIITRSINFEPEHFLEEDGYTLVNYLKFVPKLIGEWLTVRRSDVMLSITPKEEKVYRNMGSRYAKTLPLRGLPRFTTLARHTSRDTNILHGFFMGSSYHVAHNRAALEAIVRHIAPGARAQYPGTFVFHVLGSKVPEALLHEFDGETLIYDGPKYGADLDAFIARMDFAIVPSLMGAGQQQKVFEPITRGVPTITSARAIADYPLKNGEAYIAAHTSEEFVKALESVRSRADRDRIGSGGSEATASVFSQEALDRTVSEALTAALPSTTRKRYNRSV